MLHDALLSGTVSKGKIRALKRKKRGVWPLLESMYAERDLSIPMNHLRMFFEEELWSENGKRCVFIEYAEQAHNLINAKFNINHLVDNILPFKSFMLCLPTNFEIAGLKPSAILISCTPYNKTSENINRLFKKTFPITLETDGEITHNEAIEGAKYAFSLTYQFGNERANFSLDDLGLVKHLNGENIMTYSEQLSDEDANISKLRDAMIKLVFGMAVYLKAKPSSLQSGLPSNFKSNKDMITGMQWNKFGSSNSVGSLKGLHYRSWHIRQLMHAKYYQGDYCGLNTGERYIFVSGSIVGGNVDENTLILDVEE